ncbi:MAG: nucleoside deaminase, partial [Finegoldia magna]|nr:nucleoside deaminase [Finegoldia magna]
VETDNNATMHAELKAINQATKVIGNFRLDDCTMYVTLEPCVMCTGALIYSRIPKVVFGSFDKKRGACGSLLSLNDYEGLNHKIEVKSSIMEKECVELLQSFFRGIREKNRNK